MADTKYQSFLEAEDNFCTLASTKEDLSDLTIKLDRSKILTAGRKGTFSVLPSEPTSGRAWGKWMDGTLTCENSSRGRLPAEASHLQVHR